MTSSSSIHWTKLRSREQNNRQVDSQSGGGAPIRYDIYFPAPPEASQLEILRYHLTTRNLFAFFLNKSLVGLTYYQALVDLQERLEDILPSSNSTQTIIDFLVRNKLYDVSNEPSAAAGLLGWSEDNFWSEGWQEAYVHCSGMYPVLRKMPDFRDISHSSRASLERSNLELLAKVEQAEETLATFSLDEMWPTRSDGRKLIPASFTSLQRFLIRHYEKQCKTWPPGSSQDGGIWLTRNLLTKLREDSRSLYQYYVDRDVVWDETKQYMLNTASQSPLRSHDCEGFCLEKVIRAFDQKYHFEPVPNPYPLLPDPIPISEAVRHVQSKSIFGSRTKALEKQIIANSCGASNAGSLPSKLSTNTLVEAFIKFDKSDNLGQRCPHVVRKERWVLVYGVLQSLSHLNTDTPGVLFQDHVDYFTNARLKGVMPWKTIKSSENSLGISIHEWLSPYI